ncbi:MAG TPA: nuclear transport factor 2 family protein [Burkholderiales bacterium]
MTQETRSREDELAAHLLALEETLLAQATRQDTARLDMRLADDVIEHGVSGTVWTKPAVLAALKDETHSARHISDFTVRLLTADVALATYRVRREAAPGGALAARLDLAASERALAPGVPPGHAAVGTIRGRW